MSTYLGTMFTKRTGSIFFLALLGYKGVGGPAPTIFEASTVDRYVAEQVKEHNLVGMSLAVVRDGQVVLAKGYGSSSREKSEPVTPQTQFAIGSVTKQFVCACILLLAEDGKLAVEDKVAKWYPALTRAEEITLLDLMQHVSGYPDYYPLDFVDRRMKAPIVIDELIRLYAGGKLDFEPGTKWSYSNTGYMILGRVVEKVTGESFGQFLQQRIFGPLGMTQTRFGRGPERPGLAQGYTSFALSAPMPATPEAEGWLFTAGDIYSTALDLVKWDLALIEGKVLKPASYELMTSPRQLKNGKLTTYGCGLSISLRDGWRMVSHNGAVNGFAARNATIPANKSAVIMLANTDGGSGFAKLHNELVSLMLKTASNVPKVAGLSAADAAGNFFRALQSGKIARQQLGQEFSLFLDEPKVQSASARLKPYGPAKTIETLDLSERGGMEVSAIQLTFKAAELRVLMYRTPDGLIQQFFVEKP